MVARRLPQAPPASERGFGHWREATGRPRSGRRPAKQVWTNRTIVRNPASLAAQQLPGGLAHRVRVRGLDRGEPELVPGGEAQHLEDLIGPEPRVGQKRAADLGDLQPGRVAEDDLEQDA